MDKKGQLITGVRDIFNKSSWLNGASFKRKEERFEGYKSPEVHCIQFIGRNGDANVTKLAESFYVTRGAISKMTKKLIQKGAIESYQKPENKKEVYFRLTDQGQAVFKTHEELHEEFDRRDKALFDQITEEEYDIMLRFVEKYNRHLDKEIKKLGMDIRS